MLNRQKTEVYVIKFEERHLKEFLNSRSFRTIYRKDIIPASIEMSSCYENEVNYRESKRNIKYPDIFLHVGIFKIDVHLIKIMRKK